MDAPTGETFRRLCKNVKKSEIKLGGMHCHY